MANWKITRVNYKQQGDYRLISSLRWRADLYDSATDKSASEQGIARVENMRLYYDSADAGVDSFGQQEYLDILFSALGYDYVDGISSQLAEKVSAAAIIPVAPADVTAASVPSDDTDSDYWSARFDTLQFVGNKLKRYATEDDLDSDTRVSLIENQVRFVIDELEENAVSFQNFGINFDSVNEQMTDAKLVQNDLQDV